MPVLEQVFEMPPSSLKRGSDEWIREVIASKKFSYVDCVSFEPLMKACVTNLLKSGDEKGFPIMEDGEEAPQPSQLYSLHADRVFRPRATTHQKELPFLRASSFQAAVLGCKNACLYPVQVSN